MCDIWKEGIGFIGKGWEEGEKCYVLGYKILCKV